ncbi:phosphatase PAP2 family protein [Sphingomonas alpina]|uniref:Phosphatase PAP2 family protein n=1 Tax=Sphingomonas alpina TaxID=653931 RepID=A0A7H0LEH5_9SPHN|nr:phosphatase PAP2 family protein [Sphingomonas alpina]QNQ08078.1 phosphatase PAP2 family protein [Sphingomonas alpina]
MSVRAGLWLYASLALIGVTCALAAAGLSIDFASSGMRGVLMASVILLALRRDRIDNMVLRTLTDIMECLGLLSLLSLLGALASYAVAATTTGYVDHLLAAIDASLGFDWVAFYRFFAHNPAVAHLAILAYSNIFYSPAVILVALVVTGRRDRAHIFLMAYAIALTATVAAFALFPAQGALLYYIGWKPDFMPAIGLDHVMVIANLRSGAMTVINPATLSGLISFPSFHAAAALLFIWAAWPLKLLRWPMVAINVAMLFATPVHGCHYLIDVIGGLMIAGLSIAALRLPIMAILRGDVPRLAPKLALAKLG